MADTSDIELAAGAQLLGLTEATARAIGARLCYGEAVQHADRTIIPVTSVFTVGGLGFGNSRDAPKSQEGGGGGGVLGARPVGFIEIADGVASFRRIITAGDVVQVLLGAAVLAALFGRTRRRRRRG